MLQRSELCHLQLRRLSVFSSLSWAQRLIHAWQFPSCYETGRLPGVLQLCLLQIRIVVEAHRLVDLQSSVCLSENLVLKLDIFGLLLSSFDPEMRLLLFFRDFITKSDPLYGDVRVLMTLLTTGNLAMLLGPHLVFEGSLVRRLG